MIDRPKITINYSTPDVEHDIERLERERCRKIEDYNEATFGDRHPWLADLWRWLLTAGLGVIILLALPRSVSDFFAMAFMALFRLWLEERR
jgi:hypothetical protein